jgi:hypothetical protein
MTIESPWNHHSKAGIYVFWLKRTVFLAKICRSSCDHKETNFECLGRWRHGDPGSSPSVNLYEEPWSDDWMIWGYPHDFGITHWHVLYIHIMCTFLCRSGSSCSLMDKTSCKRVKGSAPKQAFVEENLHQVVPHNCSLAYDFIFIINSS